MVCLNLPQWMQFWQSGFSLDLAKFLEFAEKEILPEIGDEVKLDEPIPELGGLSPLDAINAFTGEFLVSITDIKMPAPAAGAGGPGADPFGGAAPPEANPFGDPEMEEGDTYPFLLPEVQADSLVEVLQAG